MYNGFSLFGAVLALTFAAGSGLAEAQTESSATGSELAVITVTAQKRAENLQDVPLAVSAVTAETLEQFASPDLTTLSGAIPNVYVQPTPGGSGIIQVSIRGIQFAENEKSFEMPVGVVLDGVYLGAAQGALLQTFDLERIEVLRGPQGTLFGKNTTGGVVNAVRTRPTGQWGAKLAAKVGNFDRRDYKAVVNFPLVEQRLAGKIAVFSEDEGGVRNLAFPGRRDGERDYLSASATLLFTPSDRWDVLLTYDHVRDKSDSTPLVNQFQSTPTVLPIPNDPPVVYPADRPCTIFNICPPLDLRHTRMNAPGSVDSTLDAVTANITWNLTDDLDIVATTGWRDGTEDIFMDWDATEYTIFHTVRDDEKLRQFSQELRLEGRISPRWNLVAGLFYFDQAYKTDVPRVQDIGYIRGIPELVGVRNLFFPDSEVASRTWVDYDSTSYAAFAQADWSLTDRLTLTLGARYTHDEKEIDFRLLNPDGTVVGPAQGALVPQAIVQKESWSEVTPRVSLQYWLADHVQTYVSYTRGYNAGGFSGRASDISTVGPYDPETITSYELGMKSEWLDRRLRLNGAIFHTRYKDKQEEVNTPTTLPPFTGTNFTNAASARLQGLELELTALPLSGLTVNASLGYLDAEYKDFTANITGAGVTDNSSLKLRRAPEITGNIGADYSFRLGTGFMDIGARYRYVDDHELSVTNDPVGHVPGTGYVDASASYTVDTANASYRLNFYGRNLGDKVVKNVFFRTGGFLAFTSAERGREYGVEMQVEF